MVAEGRASSRSGGSGGSGDDSTRERILTAALPAFAEHGFEGARTRDIAERAGCNLGLIKYYFGSKEKLWEAAVTRAFDELQAELAGAFEARAGQDERQQLETIVRRFVRFVARNPAFMQVMNDEGKRNQRRMRWLVNRFVRPMFDVLRDRVEAAQRRGLVPRISPVTLHYMVLGAAGLVFSEAAECRYMTGVDPTAEGFAEEHAEALLLMMTGGMSAQTTRRPVRSPDRRTAKRPSRAR